MTPEAVENFSNFIRLVPLGFLVGGYGTLIGAGGGFVLVPLLLLMIPGESAATVTSMSLAVVFFNAYSGTLAYARMGRIDYFSGLLFALAGIPGTILGTIAVSYIPRQPFDITFGVLLLAIGLFLAIRPLRQPQKNLHGTAQNRTTESSAPVSSSSALLGSVASGYIGLFSGFLGIGGGIIHVPFLIRVLHFAPHVATATSHFVLAIVALVGTLSHVISGEFQTGIDRTMYLAVGVMMGAPLGAMISGRVRGSWIVRGLALALCFVSARLLWKAVMGQV
jgi:uncharacterized membrane protein YfcA